MIRCLMREREHQPAKNLQGIVTHVGRNMIVLASYFFLSLISWLSRQGRYGVMRNVLSIQDPQPGSLNRHEMYHNLP